MTISVTALAWLISLATILTVLTPVILLILWINDWRKGQLW